MPATVAQRHEANRDPVRSAHIILLEIQEDGASTIHRAAINNEDITSNGQTYVASDISVTLPGAGDDEISVKLDMSNLTRVPGKALNLARGRVGCRLMLIDADDPDTLIMDTKNSLILTSASGDSVRVSADLGMRASLQEPVPDRRTSRMFFPGVWFLPK